MPRSVTCSMAQPEADRRDIVREIIEIVTEVARGAPLGGQDPLD